MRRASSEDRTVEYTGMETPVYTLGGGGGNEHNGHNEGGEGGKGGEGGGGGSTILDGGGDSGGDGDGGGGGDGDGGGDSDGGGSDGDGDRSLVVIIERASASVRRIANIDELCEALAKAIDDGEQVAGKAGSRRRRLVRVRSDELSVRDQMRVFERSTVVIGMHGAGLANILFCAPGTHVIELLPVR